MKQEIYDTIVELIDETCEEVEADQIHPEVNLLSELAVDSLSLLEIVFEIEDRYDIKLGLEQWNDENAREEENQSKFVLSNVIALIEELIEEKTRGGGPGNLQSTVNAS